MREMPTTPPAAPPPPLHRWAEAGPAPDGPGAPARIALLGATGSIGAQVCDLVGRFPERFELVAVSAHHRVERLRELLAGLPPGRPGALPWIAVGEAAARRAAAAVPGWRGRLLAPGEAGLREAVELPEVDVVVNALVGAVGLAPTLAAAARGRRICLANKESLVVGGELVRAAVARGGATVAPVDSEHAAIAQCLAGRARAEVERLTLTASGGPFRDWPPERLREATVAQVLAHPTWVMGPKITVDSATLMNKGLEVIEAHHLFGLPYGDIDVVVHPGSIVHSLVTFRDGALLAQLGPPDMRVPLLHALAGERHWPLEGKRLDLIDLGALRFEAPDTGRFPCLALARRAGEAGGRAPIVLNAANEVAVAALLDGRLSFAALPGLIEAALAAVPQGRVGGLEEALDVDRHARAVAAARLPGAT